MEAKKLILEQIKKSHELLEGTMEGVDGKLAGWVPPGKANPIGATYAHLVMSEDMIVNRRLREKDMVSEKTDTGLSQPMPGFDDWEAYPGWTRDVKVDLPSLKSYAKAVYSETERFVENLSEDELDEQVEMFGSRMPKALALSTLVAGHTDSIAGEIAALKGIQGLKGYPW